MIILYHFHNKTGGSFRRRLGLMAIVEKSTHSTTVCFYFCENF
jgi:hypothetical protein